ncbi:phosphotransferase family protein [Frankia sp. AiPs1]|uniref:phosphotransferase family protein n=1 Tax=Frankia sp. AiPs1 TaxID=573493 RepID=UPI002043BA10|nr:phosphotransferase family protein [Frankia sp. AiPs1]MCM3922624.1 phosphotransferase family protein [Frankia sp. AiPs1]
MPEVTNASYIESGLPTRDRQRDPEKTRQALQSWFSAVLPHRSDLRVTEVTLPGTAGVANETLLCETSWTEAGVARSAGYVVRVNSPDFLYKDADLTVHAEMYRVLGREPGIPVPAVVGIETDTGLLGEAFFVMERVDGRVPGDTPPFHTTGWVHDLPPGDRAVLWHNAVEVMARLHQVDPAKVAFLDRPHLGPDGLRQDLAHWFDVAAWVARGRTDPVITRAERWLRTHVPPTHVTALAWGDSRLPNLMFRGLDVAAVFDWDMVCLAGAESDLAWWTVMDYSSTESVGVERLPGIGSPVQTVRRWQELVGRDAEHLDFHLVYASYRLAVILWRLGDLYGATGAMAPATIEELRINNIGQQYLVQLLDLPHPHPVTMTWPGLEI